VLYIQTVQADSTTEVLALYLSASHVRAQGYHFRSHWVSLSFQAVFSDYAGAEFSLSYNTHNHFRSHKLNRMSKEETFKLQSRKISSSNCLKGWMAFNTHWTVYLRNPVRNLPLHTTTYKPLFDPSKQKKKTCWWQCYGDRQCISQIITKSKCKISKVQCLVVWSLKNVRLHIVHVINVFNCENTTY
jgi:hypothetical protein